MNDSKEIFYTVYIFGRNYDKMKRSSSNFKSRLDAENWAEFLNSEEEDNKPANKRLKHFVIQVF
jgi:hypothetical protein